MNGKTFKQKIHIKAIIGNIGLFLHIPALMAFISVIISWIFAEYYSIFPLLMIGLFNLLLAQLLYRLFFKPDEVDLWDAMISIALGWLFCPLFGAAQFFIVSKIAVNLDLSSTSAVFLSDPLNSIFESFSGFTSSGLTMLKKPSDLPHVLQWLRSFQQWVGGLGLIIFVLSLMEPKSEDYRLFFSENKSTGFNTSIEKTTRSILLIYLIFTSFGILLFFVFGMPIWQAINHTFSGIATGGFTITDNSFMGYSSVLKFSSIIIMILGSMSFSLHYKMLFRKNFIQFFKNIQNRIYFILLILGSLLLFLLAFKNVSFLDSIFQWVSSLGTCGFHSIKLSELSAASRVLIVIGMLIGGCSGSTVGGIKIRRIIFLFQAVILRIKSFTILKEKKILKINSNGKLPKNEEPSGVYLPEGHKTERLYEASVLFFIWIVTLFTGYLLVVLCEPGSRTLDVFFDVTSALSNVGLSTGVTSASMCTGSKIVLTIIMWLGRLEIIPMLVLVMSFFLSFPKPKKKR
ncbi:MAG: TrkH family potassium uptake protein [Parachlamydiales bacterium]|nr:TrkH family potassium uptake protein [Parachlamydiales bacterium]